MFANPDLHSNKQIQSLDNEHIKLLNSFIHKHLAILFERCEVNLDIIDLYIKEVHIPYEPKISRFMSTYDEFDSENKKYDLILFITAAHHILNFPEIPSKYFFPDHLNKLIKDNGLILFPDDKIKNWEINGFISYFMCKKK